MRLLFSLWMLIASSIFIPYLTPKRAPDVLFWVHKAAIQSGATEDEAKLAAVWLIRESGGDPNAVNPTSGACGVMQELGAGRRGRPCIELQADPVLAIQVWFWDLDDMLVMCGKGSTLTDRLGGLSSGTCGGMRSLVKHRCWQAGVVCP